MEFASEKTFNFATKVDLAPEKRFALNPSPSVRLEAEAIGNLFIPVVLKIMTQPPKILSPKSPAQC